MCCLSARGNSCQCCSAWYCPFLFCLLPNFLFHKNLMRAHIVTLVLDAEKVLTILFTNESSHYCVYIFRVSDNLLKVNKPTLPLASGEFSVSTAVLLVVAFLVMVMLYVSHRDLRTIYSGISHGLIFFSHCSFFLRFVRALASE
jgi:hypothetical protein